MLRVRRSRPRSGPSPGRRGSAAHPGPGRHNERPRDRLSTGSRSRCRPPSGCARSSNRLPSRPGRSARRPIPRCGDIGRPALPGQPAEGAGHSRPGSSAAGRCPSLLRSLPGCPAARTVSGSHIPGRSSRLSSPEWTTAGGRCRCSSRRPSRAWMSPAGPA